MPWSPAQIWNRYVFAPMMDRNMGHSTLAELRKKALSGIGGRVLEIGAGTGLNLQFYTTAVRHLTVLEPNEALMAFCAKRTLSTSFEANLRLDDVSLLASYPDGSFDSVVSTWVLCSVPDMVETVRHIRRVLRPGGRFVFIEHGLAPDARTSHWQSRLTPLQRCIGRGCNLDRPIKRIIEQGGFSSVTIEQNYLRGIPAIIGFTSCGIAVK